MAIQNDISDAQIGKVFKIIAILGTLTVPIVFLIIILSFSLPEGASSIVIPILFSIIFVIFISVFAFSGIGKSFKEMRKQIKTDIVASKNTSSTAIESCQYDKHSGHEWQNEQSAGKARKCKRCKHKLSANDYYCPWCGEK